MTRTPPDPQDTGGVSRGDSSSWFKLYVLGFQFAFTLGASTLVGYWLDLKLGWQPWCTLLGALLGGVGGTIALYRQAFRADEPSRGE